MDNTCWVIDASMPVHDGMFCFCPIEGDFPDGEWNILTGVNYIVAVPPGKIVAIVHSDGNEAVVAFCEKYREELTAFVKDGE